MRISLSKRVYVYLFICIFLLAAAGFVSCAEPAPANLPGPGTEPTPPPAAPQASSPTYMPTPSEVEDWSADGAIKEGEYSGLNNYGEYSVYWRFDDQFVYIGITAKTDGWVAIALQPGLRMKDADMALGFVENGKAQILDAYCTDNLGTHPADTELGGTDDIMSSGGKEEGGSTTIEFKRLMVTGDKYDISVKKGVNKIIWAYGSSDNPTLKHARKGYGEIGIN